MPTGMTCTEPRRINSGPGTTGTGATITSFPTLWSVLVPFFRTHDLKNLQPLGVGLQTCERVSRRDLRELAVLLGNLVVVSRVIVGENHPHIRVGRIAGDLACTVCSILPRRYMQRIRLSVVIHFFLVRTPT